MFGVRPDIPGFHYYDRERRGDIHFPRPGHAAWVEAKQAAGRTGILRGGSAYGCVFTGGADNNQFSFATLTRPTGKGVLRAFSAFVVAGWVLVKCVTQTAVEIVRATLAFNYLDEDFLRRRDAEAHQRDGVRVISAGPNAFLYVLDATAALDVNALEHRFPGVPEELSRSTGVGFVLARSPIGPVCFWRGKRYQLSEAEPGPFAGRTDAAVVLQDIADLMAMPSAGDLVIYGIDAPEGHVSFIPEMGAHAGPSPDELHTFIIASAKVNLPSRISHPVQLYDHFIRYQRSA